MVYRVRQGGVLSPKLFAIYIDDLSNELALCKSGCYINKVLKQLLENLHMDLYNG